MAGKKRGPKWDKKKAQNVLRLSYTTLALKDVGARLHISRERARQLYKKLTGLSWGEIKRIKKAEFMKYIKIVLNSFGIK